MTAARAHEHTPHTPGVELDVAAALSAIHTTGRRLAPDARGGTALDVGHPATAPLLPYLGATGTWVLLSDPSGVAGARRAARFADTVVLDAQAARGRAAQESGADLVVLPVDRIGAAAAPAALLDLTGLAPWRIAPGLFTGPEVAGFHLDLPGPPDPAVEAAAAAAIACGLRRWAAAGRGPRPVLLVRGAGPLAVRRVVGAVLRACRSGSLPVPVLRADVTGTVLESAVRTVVRVLAVETRGSRALLRLDGLPAAVDPALRVLQPRGSAQAGERVLITARGRLRTAWLHGGPVVPGVELAAGGWVQTGHPVAVRGFPATE